VPKRLITAIALLAPLGAQAATPSVVCGGIGSDERHAMQAQAGDANVSLEFFVGKRGAYVADVELTFTPVKGLPSFSTHADGPLCYARLDPGTYRVEATYRGATRVATAKVSDAGAPVHLAMGFPESVAQPDPAPVSAEEKRQASEP